MKKLVLTMVAFATFCATFAQTQKDKVATYISTYSQLAINEEVRTGVPASITLAQGLLETMNGQSSLCTEGNNHFGIKCKTDWTGETMSHDDDQKGECFRKYQTAEHSYRDHSDFLVARPHYAFLFKLDPTDYEGWAKGLKKAGYATSPTYAQKLIKTIVENGLQQYTLIAIERQKNPMAAEQEPLYAINVNLPATTENKAATEEKEQQQGLKPAEMKSMVVAQTIVAAPTYPTEPFTINNIKVVYASEGTSLFALASKNSVSYDKLLAFNDLKDIDILKNGQLIFLENKSKKGHTNFHTVEAGETLYDVAQKEGVHVKDLVVFNNFKNTEQQLTAGSKLYLRDAKEISQTVAKLK